MVPIIHVGCLSRSWNQSSLKGECGTKGAIMHLISCVGNKYRLVPHLRICLLPIGILDLDAATILRRRKPKLLGLTRIDSKVRDFDETGEEDEVYPSCCAHS